MQQKIVKLDSLTGLRFFAALAIFYIHIVYFIPTTAMFQSAAAKAVLPACSAGVCLFFLLSGFILAYTHSDIVLTSPSLYKFWTSRVARIYPVYLLALVLYSPFILVHRFSVEPVAIAINKTVASLLPSLFLVQSWGHPRFAIAWNGPGWSLSVEAALYVLFPWMTHHLAKLSQRSLLWTIASLLLLSVVLSAAVPRVLAGWPYAEMFVNFNPIFHLPTFGIGIALGCHFLRSQAARKKNEWLAVWAGASIVTLAIVAPYVSPPIVHNSLFVLPFAALIYGLARGGKLSGFFAIPLFVLLGEASYSFYILQFPIGATFRWLNEGLPVTDLVAALPAAGVCSGAGAAVGCLILSVGISIIIHRVFEVPLRRRFLGYLQRWVDKSPTSRLTLPPVRVNGAS